MVKLMNLPLNRDLPIAEYVYCSFGELCEAQRRLQLDVSDNVYQDAPKYRRVYVRRRNSSGFHWNWDTYV